MKVCSLIFILLFAAVSANSQVNKPQRVNFLDVFNALKTPGGEPSVKCDAQDEIQKRILFEYGAVFVSKGAILPPTCLFKNETEIADFTKRFKNEKNKFNFGDFYLQPKAIKSLIKVFNELGGYENVARNCNDSTSCTNLINDDWALRTFSQQLCNWGKGKVADEIKDTPVKDENDKDYYKKPKMFRTAIPGGSQHQYGLAIDVNDGTSKLGEYKVLSEEDVKKLQKHGWFRTVRYDVFHFTYLGLKENELERNGLKKVSCYSSDFEKSFDYWVPYVDSKIYKSYTNWECE